MPNNNVLYYTRLVDLCNIAGEWVSKKRLLDDIREGDPTSPESIKVLAKYYDGDVNVLAEANKKVATKANNLWFSLAELLKAEGRWDDSDSKVFLSQLKKPVDFCDFRAKVRDWSRAELKREQNGKESTFYDYREMLDRYQKLVLKREQKK